MSPSVNAPSSRWARAVFSGSPWYSKTFASPLLVDGEDLVGRNGPADGAGMREPVG
jgi:hypothetical protein